MKLKFFLPLAAFVALAIVLGIGLGLNPREVPSPYIGKPAPGKVITPVDVWVTVTPKD